MQGCCLPAHVWYSGSLFMRFETGDGGSAGLPLPSACPAFSLGGRGGANSTCTATTSLQITCTAAQQDLKSCPASDCDTWCSLRGVVVAALGDGTVAVTAPTSGWKTRLVVAVTIGAGPVAQCHPCYVSVVLWGPTQSGRRIHGMYSSSGSRVWAHVCGPLCVGFVWAL